MPERTEFAVLREKAELSVDEPGRPEFRIFG